MRRLVLLLLTLVSVAGCSFGFRQLDTVRRAVPAMLPTETNKMAREAQKYAWEFRFNDMQFIVYPIEISGQSITFASPYGMRLKWDGSTIQSIEQFPGAFGPYRSGVDGRRRWYERDGYDALFADCDDRREWRLTPERSGWRQECRGLLGLRSVRTMHAVEVGPTGRIKLIETTLWPTVPPATLRPTGELARAD